MARIDEYPNQRIAEQVLALEKENKHVPSGKLSASLLGNPLQWQILKVFGIKGEAFDEYTLRKFQRGKDVEARVLGWLDVIEGQKFVEYRGTVGYMDALVDTGAWNFKNGIMPLEIKSVTNAKYKRILQAGKPDRGHALQGCLYALGEGKDWFAVMYVASDDYRVHTFILPVSEYKDEVDRIIDRFNAQLLTGRVPAFVPDEAWQANPKYNNFPEWATMTEDEIEERLQAMIKANKK